jgi:hypothetical protein
MKARSPRLKAVALAAALLLTGCATTFRQADQFFDAGDYVKAAEGYESALAKGGEGRNGARSLFRLGVSRAQPGDAAYDPAKARAAFERLVSAHPGSSFAKQARLPLALLKELDEADRRSKNLKAELGKLRLEMERREEDSRGQSAKVKALEDQVSDQERAIERLKSELDQLKRVDLGRAR